MAEYQYIAYYGESKRVVKGIEKASSAEAATMTLTSRGYKILSIKSVSGFLPSGQLFSFQKKIPTQTVIAFSRQMALLIESGTPIVNALDLLRQQATNRPFKEILTEVISDLRRGQSLSKSMSKHPSVFSKMYIQSILVGEQSGSLETVIRQLADYMEREDADAKSVKNALRYPAILAVVAIAVVAILGIFVLPKFADIYSSLDMEMPTISVIVLDSIQWFGKYGIFILAGLGLVIFGLYTYSKTPDGKYFTDKTILRMPILGRIVHLGELSGCCRSMAILHKSGLPISEIMALVTDSSKNSVTQQAFTQVHQDVLKGQGIAASMAKNELFLPMMVQMASVGEATGTLDETLTATAKSYEAEAADRTKAMIDLIQPVITVAIALFVGLIAVALISAMYSMYGQFGAN
jgi:type IV pilus assembly protein PilC